MFGPYSKVLSVEIVALTTSAVASTYTAFPSQMCSAIDIVNTSDTDIEYRRNSVGETMVIASGESRLVMGITNADQIEVRGVGGAISKSIKAEVIRL